MEKCAATALNSKLIAGQKEFFSKMVVDAVMSLDELMSLKMIGIKKVQGGALEVGARKCDFFFFFLCKIFQNNSVKEADNISYMVLPQHVGFFLNCSGVPAGLWRCVQEDVLLRRL